MVSIFREDLRYRDRRSPIRLKPLENALDNNSFKRSGSSRTLIEVWSQNFSEQKETSCRCWKHADWRETSANFAHLSKRHVWTRCFLPIFPGRRGEKSLSARLTSENFTFLSAAKWTVWRKTWRTAGTKRSGNFNNADYRQEKEDFDRQRVETALAKNNEMYRAALNWNSAATG